VNTKSPRFDEASLQKQCHGLMKLREELLRGIQAEQSYEAGQGQEGRN
jgi:hypothetical protein